MDRFYVKGIIITIFFQSAILLGLCTKSYAQTDSLLHIKLSGAIYSDETYLRLMHASTTNFDFDFDAYKIMSGGTTPSIYTTIAGTNYSINSVPNFDDLSVVPLGSKILADGNYTIAFESNSTIPPYTLVDKMLGVETTIDGNFVYSYTGSVGDATDRFELHFKVNNQTETSEQTITTLEETNTLVQAPAPNQTIALTSQSLNIPKEVHVSSCPGGMFVSLTNVTEKEYTIEMIRSGGRILETMVKQINTPAYGEFIELSNLPAGSYVVRLTFGDSIATFHVAII